MVDKVWVGKKVQVLSLEELEKDYYKNGKGEFFFIKWFDADEHDSYIKYGGTLTEGMRRYCSQVVTVIQVVKRNSFLIKEDKPFHKYWNLWMVKEPVSIQDVLDSE